MREVYNNQFSKNICNIFSSIILIIISVFVDVFLGEKSNLGSFINALVGSLISYNLAIWLSKLKVKGIIEEIGNYSLQFYLLNGFMLVPSRVLVVNILKIYNPIVVITTIFIANVLGAYIISKYIFSKSKIMKYVLYT